MLLQLYSSSQEDPEVRIAAYQQLMLCPEQQVFHVVKATLHSDASSQGQTEKKHPPLTVKVLNKRCLLAM